ncbi:MAG: ATP-dependent Clp protease ATP-binding subunit [bacterium]|nr:ATP-dependent Clp protease ATP-binding subunit [bacterium]
MHYETLKKTLTPWKPVYLLEQTLPRRARGIVKTVLILLFAITSIWSIGLGLAFFSLWLILSLFDCFFYSLYFKRSKDTGRFACELALIVFGSPEGDLTYGFMSAKLGREILWRCGIDQESQKNFLSNRKSKVTSASFKLTRGHSILRGYLGGLLTSDIEFKNFILTHHVTEEEFLGAATWTASVRFNILKSKRWWGKDNLFKIDPIGRDWSYGKSFSLMKYARPLIISDSMGEEGYHIEEAKLLEIALSRSHEANALLVGDDGVGKMEVLEELHKLIEKDEVSAALSNKQIWVFEISTLSAAASNGQILERELIKVLQESERAGNVIFVIPNMAAFLSAGNSYGVSVLALLSPFLSSSQMQIVGVSNTEEYQRLLEPLGEIKQHFEKVNVLPVDEDALVQMLESEVNHLEKQMNILISYPALSEAVAASKQYFVDRPLADSAMDLIATSSAKVSQDGRGIVNKEDILSAVKSKTGIPTGFVKPEEKDKLLNLEIILKERIVGQDDAIKAVSDAVRRARSGIGNPLRPAGSFLFIGPTGVGKTETAKALGEVFFGQASKLLRLDMSEYNAPDSLNRLIGSFESKTPGTLTTLLRENPYGVLLLDEFEKTDSKVLDLFLQIIDEGIFSDMRGEKVSARNVIIVATSNAGSDLIFEYVKSGKDLSLARETIINEIIAKGIFKPELLNRFDGVILFHPLDEASLREVSKRLLSHLTLRLKKQGITLKISDSLISFLTKKGMDPKFGARPLNRAIQETVEQVIAKKMISGEITSGSEIELTEKDVNG